MPTMAYGMPIDDFHQTKSKIKNNEFFSEILARHKVDYVDIDEIWRTNQETFDVRNLRAGKDYTILNQDTTTAADYFVYEPSVFEYVVFDLKKKTVEITKRPITTEVATATGVVETSLWNTMIAQGHSFDLAARMEDAFAWSVDFHHLQKGDRFKLIYERQLIDGEEVGVGDITGAYFQHKGEDNYAVYFENDRHSGFYDLEARPMKKAFLISPVKYSRISSGYNLRRFHPVLRRVKAHLGTDYAAPRGTPIMAVANGTVTKASYTRGNGNYVKIKHDDTYQTQYLHMQKFAKGIAPGVPVKQGQIIGYVGSTGLATGPHVCFRFWKNGRQVNHRRLNLPPPDPMPEKDVPAFEKVRDGVKAQLDQLHFPAPKVEEKPEEQVTS